MLSKVGEIRRDEACLDYAGTDIVLYPCHGSKGNQVRLHLHEFFVQNFKIFYSFSFPSGGVLMTAPSCSITNPRPNA
jgi:hypothetical protein